MGRSKPGGGVGTICSYGPWWDGGEGLQRVHVTRGGGTRGTQGKGTHICTLDICRARVVGDSIGGAGSEHGWGELRWVGRHEHTRSTMVSTMSRWPPVGGHPAMVVAIDMRLGGTQKRSTWEGGIKGARLLFRRCLDAFLILAFLSWAGFV